VAILAGSKIKRERLYAISPTDALCSTSLFIHRRYYTADDKT
jgi:hypothetical protein